jgi:hypothetical protein
MDAQRFREVILRDRRMADLAIGKTGADEYEFGGSVLGAQRLEQHEIAAAVDVEIGPGVFHAPDRTRLSSQVEDNFLCHHSLPHRIQIAQIGFDGANALRRSLGCGAAMAIE